jgi:hypothetical protein
MGLFDATCGRPVLPDSKDKKVQERRVKQRVPVGERKTPCGRKPLPPSDDPKVEARRQKARANAEKKREAVKQDKAGGMINQAIKMKIARKKLNDAKPPPAQTPFNNVKLITRFLKDKLILNKYTLQNRINRYNVISKALDTLTKDDCLEKKGEGFTIRNILNLENKIGTKSKYGTIYLTSLPNVLGSFPIASKVMPDTPDNLLETILMKRITEKVILTGKSKHFTIMYKYSVCKDKKINAKLRLVNYNELCNGDLKSLIKDKNLLSNEEFMFNIFFQTYISIATFHNIVGYIHKDCHYGNFLYQLNNETGYYHYRAGTNDFYLKSCPYNMIIYDYGLSQQIKQGSTNDEIVKVHKRIFEDYGRILNAFLSKKLGWGHYLDLPSPDFENKVKIINANLLDYIYKSTIKNPPEFVLSYRESFFINVLNLFKQYAPTGMILTNRPTNVINTSPYYIFGSI